MERGLLEPSGRVIVINDEEVYTPHAYEREAELESRVSRLIAFVFGPEALYFDIRQRLSSKARKINVTDGLLLELKREGKPKLWLVEYELSSHDLYSHIQPQLMGFIRSLRNPETLRDIQLTLYEEIKADDAKWEAVQGFLGPRSDIYFFLDRVLHRRCGVIIVIDRATPQLMEICEDLSRYAEVRVIEFQTYRKDGKEIYHFNPFKAEEAPEPSEPGEEPEHRRSWEARLGWVDEGTRRLVRELIKKMDGELLGISHRPRHRWYYFYRDEGLFAVLLLSKRKVDVRIRVDPGRFDDRLGLTKRYKGWFFRRGEERGFSITNPQQLDDALELIRQAYACVS